MHCLAQLSVPMIPTSGELLPFASEGILVAGILLNLLVPFFSRKPNLPCWAVTFGAVLLSLIAAAVTVPRSQPLLHGMLVMDAVARFWKVTLLLFVAGLLILWLGHTGPAVKQGDAVEFFIALQGATLGMCLMAGTTNLLMMFMALATGSLPSYVLAGYRKGSRRGSEAALKYVLQGSAAAAVMVYGMSFLYGIYGTLNLQDIPTVSSPVVTVALLAVFVGLGFKIAAVPLHFWCPDVFEGSSIEVTAFLSVASKGASLVMLWRVLSLTHAPELVAVVIGLIGAVTATVGNTGAFAQTHTKRLLAYSSIAQSGYMLCAVAMTSLIGQGSSLSNLDSPAAAVLVYLMVYAFMNLGAFAVTAAVVRSSGSDAITHFTGLARRSPWLALSMFCCLISLIGLPPFAGFGAKITVLWVLAQSGPIGLVLLAAVVINTVVSAFYYFRIIRLMYLSGSAPGARLRFDLPGLILGGSCAAVLVISFFGFGLIRHFLQ